MKSKKLIALLLALALITMVVGCGSQGTSSSGSEGGSSATNSNLQKVALVINGPVVDGGWNSNAWLGLEQAKEKYGCEIAVSENVKQSDYETAFREYANQGYDLIFANGFEFTDAIKAVAPEYPDVYFAIINGGYSGENIVSLNFDEYLKGFMAGALAGLMTETNVIGYVGGEEVPSITNAREGYEAGLAYTNPQGKVVSTIADSWDDMAKGKEIAISQITSANADILYSVASSVDTGVIDGAKELGKYVIGQPNDKLDSAPGTVIASTIGSTPYLVMLAADAVAEGNFTGEGMMGTLDNGVHSWGKFGPEVPKEIQDKMHQLAQDIIDGKVKLR